MASSRQPSRARRDAPLYHIVAHTHWDREWYRPFEEFRTRLCAGIDSLLEILESDPSFTAFMLDGQASVLDDYLEIHPERKATLSRMIRSGRIATGPWYTLPDEFLVSGEAIVRNLLRGTARAKEFGHSMQVGYVPDSFGHAAAMPAIFRGFGLRHAITWRGFGGEPGQNISEWIWRSPDGSAVLMHHLHRDGYSAATFAGLTSQDARDRFRTLQKTVDARATTPHRLLLSGGDHHFPDPNLPATIRSLRNNTGADIRLSTLEKFFEGLDASQPTLDVIDGELHFGYRYAFVVSSGVYSSRITLKQHNWRIQRLYERYVEPLQSLLIVNGVSPDRALVRQGWKYLLQNQAHDSICGCSVDEVHEEMTTRFAKAEQIARHSIGESLRGLCPPAPHQKQDDASIIIFNPSPQVRSDVTAVALELYVHDVVVGLNPDVRIAAARVVPKGLRLRDASGNAVRFQIINRTDAYGIAESRYDYPKQTRVQRVDVLLDAQKLPGLSLSTIAADTARTMPRFASALRARGNTIENAFVAVTVRSNGTIALRNKITGITAEGLHLFENGGDAGDEYSYSYPKRDRIVTSHRARAQMRIVERGPLRAMLEIRLRMRIPVEATADLRGRSRKTRPLTMTSRISVTEQTSLVHFETALTNDCRDHRLRVLFNTAITTDHTRADQHFGTIMRDHSPLKEKSFPIEYPSPVHPMHRFVTIEDERNGFTLFSDGLPEYEWHPGSKTLALTLLRCVGRLSGSDLITRPGGDAGWKNETPGAQCQGQHLFRYSILSHPPGSALDIERAAEAYHSPLMAVARKDRHRATQRFCTIDNPAIILTSVKPKEIGEEIVVRMYNATDTPVDCIVRFNRAITRVKRSRLDETTGKALGITNGKVRTIFGPRELVTLLVR